MNLEEDTTDEEGTGHEANAKAGSEDDECVIVTGPTQPVNANSTSSSHFKVEPLNTAEQVARSQNTNETVSVKKKASVRYSKEDEAAILKIAEFNNSDARAKYVASLVTRLQRKKSSILEKFERLKKSRS